jgi:hypothetical protein
MKKLFFIFFICGIVTGAKAQFVSESLTFPGVGYFTFFQDAIDTNTVWVGVEYIPNHAGYTSYSNAIKTNDGGNTWQFFSIPDTGTVIIGNVCALDVNTCYYVDFNGNGNIWKTENGGFSWIMKTTTQYVGSWVNFYYAISADTGVAVGDPNGGYWDICLTNDGGNTWTRVPASNIPANYVGEYGNTSCFSAVGNYIWFTSNQGRCYRSINKGLNWTMAQVTGIGNSYNVCFVDSLRGVFWQPVPIAKKKPASYNTYFMTTDGGLTWTQQSLATRYSIRNFSRVPGVNGGMVVSAYDAGGGVSTTVLYTPDFFNTLSVVQTGILSTGESDFYNNRSGWLAGDGNYTSSIYKFTSNLPVGIQETTGEIPQIMVYPNPSSAEAIIQVPANFIQKDLILRICDIRGKIIENSVVTAASNYIQLNAEKYSDGIYIIQMTGDDGVSAVCRWTVCHK